MVSLKTGKRLIVESKKGPLIKTKSSREYPLLREALGQILTVDEVADNDLFAVAVPDSPKFQELASRWRKSPLVQKCGILILLNLDGSLFTKSTVYIKRSSFFENF